MARSKLVRACMCESWYVSVCVCVCEREREREERERERETGNTISRCSCIVQNSGSLNCPRYILEKKTHQLWNENVKLSIFFWGKN